MDAILYFEIDFLCIVMLCYILLKVKDSGFLSSEDIAFKRVTIAVIGALLLDGLWTLFDGRSETLSVVLTAFFAIAYFTTTALASYAWVMYDEVRMRGLNDVPQRVKTNLFLPVVFVFVMSIASLWTGWIFSLDATGVYERGPLFFLYPLSCYSLLLMSAARMFIHRSHEKSLLKRRNIEVVLCMCLVPCIGGALAIVLSGLPVVWPMSSLALLVLYIRSQTDCVFTDALTGLNNRRKFDAYLASLVGERDEGVQHWIVLCDLDRFKDINDSFGHMEGDRALTRVAAILLACCQNKKTFVARYGGDEFILIVKGNKLDVTDLVVNIRARCKEENAFLHGRYALNLSIGWAMCDLTNEETMLASVEAADKALYMNKREHNLTRITLPRAS